MKKQEINIFYSWESDLPKDSNYEAIENSLEHAILAIKEKKEYVTFSIDEATRNESGSPDIPSTIFSKISRSDIFVGDITTINYNYSVKRIIVSILLCW